MLKKAFKKAAEIMPDEEQDQFGQWLLEALESDERRWDAAFAAAPDKLRRLARKALDEFHSGRTEALDPEKL